MYEPVEAVEIRIWGRSVGAVALDPTLGFYAFEYQPEFIASGVELAPLHMPLSAAAEPFVFTSLPAATYQRLPALLADALPDDFGNALVDAWMAAQGIERSAITPLDRLAYMGKRGVGALEFRPVRGPTSRASTAIELASLVESARHAVRGELGEDPLAVAALKQLIQVGTSAGGARAKASVAWKPATGELRAGQFDADPGFEHWLLKFDGVGADAELGSPQNYGRIEFAYSLMAGLAGIEMAACRLLEENGRAHFMTRRFDRDHNRKLHVQSLCAMSHLDYRQKATHDYHQFFQAIRQLDIGAAALGQGFRRMAFNVMARNCDDHTKNFAFLLAEAGRWQLAPAYDVTLAYNPRGEWTRQHQMSVNGRFADITRADLLVVADRFGIASATRSLNAVRDAVAAWPDCARQAGLDKPDIRRVAQLHRLV